MADEEEKDTLLESLNDASASESKETGNKDEEVADNSEEAGDKDDDSDKSGEQDVEEDNQDSTEDENEEDQDKSGEQDSKLTRGQSRHQKLANELKKEREERAKDREDRDKLVAERATAQAQLEHLHRQRQEFQSEAQRKAEASRLELLDPTERAVYAANQKSAELEHRLNLMQMQMADNADREKFLAKAAHDQTYSKYADDVEKMHQEGLSRGVRAPREELHSLIVGRELKKDMGQKIQAKKQSAKKRVDTVTSKPASARGDVTGSKKGQSVEERLKNVLI